MGWLWGSDDKDSASSNYGSDSTFPSYDSSTDSTYSSSSLSGLEESKTSSGDLELRNFLAIEQQRAELQAMIHKMNDVCWDTCVGSPESKLSSRTETCITNCVDRFIDTSLYITNRFAQLLSKTGGLS